MSEELATRNRLATARNPYQGNFKRVLCICSAGLLRSPTAAWVLSNHPFNFNTRAVGTSTMALIPVDDVHLFWADEIVVMEKQQKNFILNSNKIEDKPIHVLNIPDNFDFRDAELVDLIQEACLKIWNIKRAL